MGPVLQRLNIVESSILLHVEDGSAQWNFANHLANQPSAFFYPLVRQHTILAIEYNALCTQLAHELAADKSLDDPLLKNKLLSALALVELLSHIYRYYLIVPRQVYDLSKEQYFFQKKLTEAGFHFVTPSNSEDSVFSFTKKVKEHTASVNWLRLFAVRTRRLLITSLPLAQQLKNYYHFIVFCDIFAQPFFSYFAWVFYVPRLTVNIFILSKHLIPHPWMTPTEKDMGFWLVLSEHLKLHWFEIANDTLWLIGSLLNCFILVGALAPIGMYLSVALAFYDVILVVIRAAIELNRLAALQEEYESMLSQETDPIKKAEIKAYQEFLEQRVNFEKQRLLLNVISMTVLFLAISLSMPVLAVNPIVPFVGAILVLLITVITYALTNKIEKGRPKGIAPLLQQTAPANAKGRASSTGMFAPKTPADPQASKTTTDTINTPTLTAPSSFKS